MGVEEQNIEILKALGVDFTSEPIERVVIQLRAGHLPSITVKYTLQRSKGTPKIRKYKLIDVGENKGV